MDEEQMDVTTADMLEIVAGGGNGVEYVDISSLIEKAAKELREKDDEIERLLDALNKIASGKFYGTMNRDIARDALKEGE